MRILICGSRNWTDPGPIAKVLVHLYRTCEEEVTVVHGGAMGADEIAGKLARHYGFQEEIWRPDYASGRGKQAPLDRNVDMLNSGVREVYAFRGFGKSNGTDHTIMTARNLGIPVTVIGPRS